MSRSYSSLLCWFALSIATSLMLYHTSDRVNALSVRLHTLDSQIEAEQQSLHILKAEWVYLANPARVQTEAARHLALQPTAPNRVVALRDIGSLLPLRPGVDPVPPSAVADAASTPVAVPTTGALHKTAVAALTGGHINEHMVMAHSAAAVEASNDGIGALIGSLSLRQ